jgi:hypothetical protein
VAAAILLLAYAQAASGLIPLKPDPLARLLGMGMRETAREAGAIARAHGARHVLTADYETTAWLRFYDPALPVVAVNQPNRYLDASIVPLEKGPLLYLAARTRGLDPVVMASFASVSRLPDISRARGGRVIGRYDVLLLDAPKRVLQAKLP